MQNMVRRVYFAVPGQYTIGDEFDTYADAERTAREQVRPIEGTDGFSRAFVALREESAERNVELVRWEVLPDGTAAAAADIGFRGITSPVEVRS